MEDSTGTEVARQGGWSAPGDRRFTYQRWMESIGLPVYRGYYVPDLRTLELGWWEERECKAAFLELAGQEGIAEARIVEVPPGRTLPPLKFALDELVYVVEGRGLTTVWTEGGAKRTFEWQKNSLFLIPHNAFRQLTNTQGTRPARLLHYNYLPLAMSVVQDPPFFFNNPHQSSDLVYLGGAEFYSEAKAIEAPESSGWRRHGILWYGNFFPDMRAWDRLDRNEERGAGGLSVFIQFPRSEMSAHMSVFPARTYKKAHRHGPGRVIVIPAGEGYSVLWEEGHEKTVVPWQEASVFTPVNRWFHQHFNLGGTPARYLALHPPMQFHGYSERIEDRARDQIEYPDEDPWLRHRFAEELAKRGLTSLMPDEAYKERDHKWHQSEGE